MMTGSSAGFSNSQTNLLSHTNNRLHKRATSLPSYLQSSETSWAGWRGTGGLRGLRSRKLAAGGSINWPGNNRETAIRTPNNSIVKTPSTCTKRLP